MCPQLSKIPLKKKQKLYKYLGLEKPNSGAQCLVLGCRMPFHNIQRRKKNIKVSVKSDLRQQTEPELLVLW